MSADGAFLLKILVKSRKKRGFVVHDEAPHFLTSHAL